MNLAASRRDFLRLAGAGAALSLAGCGSGSVASAIHPQRFYVLGDGFSDVGQTGAMATVNDGTLNWIQALAAYYGLTVTPAVSGGTGYAQAYARIGSPDTTSGYNAPSVTQQVDELLASVTFAYDDLVFINGGMHDIVDAVTAGGMSADTSAAVKAAGQALGAQVRRLVEVGGAQHVVVTGVYNMALSPWGRSTGLAPATGFDDNAPLNQLSNTFNNNGLKVSIADMGANVLYFDAGLFYNLIGSKPQNYAINNAETPVCNTPDALTCTPDTVIDANYSNYLFADSLHFTPAAQRMFVSESYATNVYTQLRQRW
jgi:phospholipase/lecithinase/hemolysin